MPERAFGNIPKEKLYIFESKVPGPLEAYRVVGAGQAATSSSHRLMDIQRESYWWRIRECGALSPRPGRCSGWFPSVPWANTPFDHYAVVGPDRLLFPHPSRCREGDSFARDGRSPGGIKDLCHGQVRD